MGNTQAPAVATQRGDDEETIIHLTSSTRPSAELGRLTNGELRCALVSAWSAVSHALEICELLLEGTVDVVQ